VIKFINNLARTISEQIWDVKPHPIAEIPR
jgi:hypothetical protein